MAITKIMCMKSAEHGNAAAHLKHSLAYICNEAKTEKGSLVGGINCLPDFAYEQMKGTKEMFGQTGGRQGYHFIISLKPGEGTREQMYEITRRFAEEFLGGEYEGVFSVHTDKDHLHGHLVYNSVNMVTGRKYSYKKGDWKDVIQPITNRLCEEYGLSIVAAEYSKDPVNMNRKQCEKEQSWDDFITGDMQYCRNKAGSFEEFIFHMVKLGYEVKMGAHISVKAEGMKRRLYIIRAMLCIRNRLMLFNSGIMESCIVCVWCKKCRFQYKYTRYRQDLIRMKELQEEYLFLNREGINGWEDVFRAKQTAEQRIVDIDAKKEYATISRCISESTFAHMEIPLDVDVENLYMVDVPELEGREISYAENEVYDEFVEHKTVDSDEYIESYIEEGISETELVGSADVLPKADVTEQNSVVAEVSQEETDVISEEFRYDVNGLVVVEPPYEPVNKSCEDVDEAYEDCLDVSIPDMTKERYEVLTDKEKVEWLGIAECSVQEAIQRFISKLDSIGVVYQYSDDMLDEFMSLESVVAQMRREERSEQIQREGRGR